MKPRRILFVTEYAGFPGGIERYAFLAASLLREAGHRVELLYKREAVEFHTFCAGFDHVSKRPAETDYDAVVIHKLTDNELLRELLARFGEKLILLVHDHDLYCPRRHYYTPCGRKNCHRAYSRLRCALCAAAVSPAVRPPWGELLVDYPERFKLWRRLRHVVVLSQFMRDNLLRNGFASERISVIHPAIDGVPAVTGEPVVPTIAFIGQLIRGKGCDWFLRMLPLLKHPYKAVVAGDGNDRPMLEALARSLKLEVDFRGFVADSAAIYREASLVVLPFRWQEPFGLVGAETAAAGLPSAAFDVGGAREWLNPGVTGVLVPYGDLPKLAAETDALLADPERRRTMGRAARAFATAEFSGASFVKAFEALLEQLR